MTTPPLPPPDPIVIQGRTFRLCTDTTWEQDLFITATIQEAKLETMLELDVFASNLDEVVKDLIVRAYKTGKLFLMLANALEEPGVPWSEEASREREQFFRTLSNRADKAKLQASIAVVIVGFYVSGVLSSRSSLSSSARVATPPFDPVGASVEARDTTSGSGTISSAPLPITTPTSMP